MEMGLIPFGIVMIVVILAIVFTAMSEVEAVSNKERRS